MILTYVRGDLVKLALNCYQNNTQFTFAHGCNCQATMLGGIALKLGDTFPDLREVDQKFHRLHKNNHDMLGRFSYFEENKIMGINIYSQFYYGSPKEKHFDINAFEKAITELNTWLPQRNRSVLFIPKIGAGLGGGDWEEIEKVINRSTPNLWIYVVIL